MNMIILGAVGAIIGIISGIIAGRFNVYHQLGRYNTIGDEGNPEIYAKEGITTGGKIAVLAVGILFYVIGAVIIIYVLMCSGRESYDIRLLVFGGIVVAFAIMAIIGALTSQKCN